jgi:hypothetical protein
VTVGGLTTGMILGCWLPSGGPKRKKKYKKDEETIKKFLFSFSWKKQDIYRSG